MGEWIELCLRSADVSVTTAEANLRAFSRLRKTWRARIGGAKGGSALDAALGLLLGVPVVTVKQAAALTGKSISVVNGAFGQLEEAGIVEVLDHDRKSRVFVAPEAIALLESLYEGLAPGSASTPDPPVRP